MNDIIDLKKKIDELKNAVWSVVYKKDISNSTLKLLFLKYAIDNYVGAENAEDMKKYAYAQKMFATKNMAEGESIIGPVLDVVDRHYGLNGILVNSDALKTYSILLSGTDSEKQKNGMNERKCLGVMEALGSMDLEEKSGNHSLGSLIAALFITEGSIEPDSAHKTTGYELSSLVKEILDVKDNDCFCDFMCGMGFSTLVITELIDSHVFCSDINVDSLAVFCMLSILQGKQNVTVKCEDSLQNNELPSEANRFFIDPPLGARSYYSVEPERKIEAYQAALMMIEEHLNKHDGLAVVAVPGAALFQIMGSRFREDLICEKRLKAVISLPPMWSGCSVGTNLVVLSSEENTDVLLIDASMYGSRSKDKNMFVLDDGVDEKILNCYINKEEIEGFSKVVNAIDFVKNDFNISPSVYIKKKKKEGSKSFSEIENELEYLYNELKKLI